MISLFPKTQSEQKKSKKQNLKKQNQYLIRYSYLFPLTCVVILSSC